MDKCSERFAREGVDILTLASVLPFVPVGFTRIPDTIASRILSFPQAISGFIYIHVSLPPQPRIAVCVLRPLFWRARLPVWRLYLFNVDVLFLSVIVMLNWVVRLLYFKGIASWFTPLRMRMMIVKRLSVHYMLLFSYYSLFKNSIRTYLFACLYNYLMVFLSLFQVSVQKLLFRTISLASTDWWVHLTIILKFLERKLSLLNFLHF